MLGFVLLGLRIYEGVSDGREEAKKKALLVRATPFEVQVWKED